MGNGNGVRRCDSFRSPVHVSEKKKLETSTVCCLDRFISGTLSGVVYDGSDLMQCCADPKGSAIGTNGHKRDGIAIHGEVADENPEKQSSMDGEFDRKGQD